MEITEATYPEFQANQVLTDAQLNDMSKYLDEQTRLTRANLIGIGIACGLDMEFNGTDTIHLTKGCGITSEGYLILETEDVDLVAVRPYVMPTDYGYPPFVDGTKLPPVQYPLWELLDDEDETGAVPLTDALLGLDHRVVVLFLELRRDGRRNCAPNNCDDRGAQVTATLRRLLIDVSDLKKVVATAGTGSTHPGADITERLRLPDLRMRRFDVPNTGPVETAEVLAAFQATFRETRLAATTAAALSALYAAFKPVVVDLFPTNPFGTFLNRFGFLDSSPVTTGQVRFLPYYWDLFDDLLAAYDELRWKGADLLCACCPPADRFPRHLLVGVLDQVTYDAADYRHQFVRSPAVGDCADRASQVRQLFRRLVAMLATFTDEFAHRGIRATPSRWGEAPLSAKAIPFYYHQHGTPPLYQLWDPVKTTRSRANQNLSYRAEEYVPAAPAFVTEPLRFDLEPNNFLRIEGHLGSDVRSVLKNLLSLRRSHRLPFEVVALRTGAFDEKPSADDRVAECCFRDLETLYDTLRAELNCFLVMQVKYFYSLPFPAEPGRPVMFGDEPTVPMLSLLRKHNPDFRAQPGTIGHAIEATLTWTPGKAYPWSFAVAWVPDLPSQVFALVGTMSDLSGRLTDDLRQLDFAAMADQYHRLVEIARRIEGIRRSGSYDAPGLADRLDDIVFRCRLNPFEALAEEWKRRLREAEQAQFLGHFLRDHPGVQHKAGVPLGGTFVLVYHHLPRVTLTERVAPELADQALPLGSDAESGRTGVGRGASATDRRALLEQALGRLQYKAALADDPDLGFVFEELTGRILEPRKSFPDFATGIYADAVAELDDGTVVADFFLPYICGPGCATVQYQLPPARLQVTTETACTNADGFAQVAVRTTGASGSLSVRVDENPFEELSGPLLLHVGEHTLMVRDSEGAESTLLRVTIPPQLRITEPRSEVDEAAGTWMASFTVEGGTAPYVADVGAIVEKTFTSPVLPLLEILTVTVKDLAGCTVEGRFESGVTPCGLPCGGEAIRQGYRFWLPEARPNLPINEYAAEVLGFVVTDSDGNRFDLTADVQDVVRRAPSPIRTADFDPTVQRWLRAINELIAGAVGSDQWLRLEYEAPAGRGTTGSLFVDRLRCLDFAYQLDVTFLQEQRQRHLILGYNSRGTLISDPNTDARARIPVFNVSSSNKCRPDEPPVPQCEGTDLTLEIGRDGVIPEVVVLSAVSSGADQSVAFLWDVQDGIPSVAGDETVSLKFEPTEPVEKLVRLTAFTEKGCVVTREEIIDISNPDG